MDSLDAAAGAAQMNTDNPINPEEPSCPCGQPLCYESEKISGECNDCRNERRREAERADLVDQRRYCVPGGKVDRELVGRIREMDGEF